MPVVSGSFAPTVPTTTAVLDELTRRFPIPRDRIVVTTRPSYVLTSVTNGVGDADATASSAEWSAALVGTAPAAGQRESRQHLSLLLRVRSSLRAAASRASATFRAAPRSDGTRRAAGCARCPMNWDTTSAVRTRRAVASTGADTNWPAEYAGGSLGPQPLVDSVPAALDVVSPLSQTDIMGYCSGTWFSDYNYRLMQTHLESQPQAALAFAQAAVGLVRHAAHRRRDRSRRRDSESGAGTARHRRRPARATTRCGW